jgi:hypothetical protein
MPKGKSIADDLISGLESVTKSWAKQRKAEEHHASARANRHIRMMRSRRTTQKDVVFQSMEEAYLKASADGTLPANCRQIYYAIRPRVQEEADTKQQFNYPYFQTLLAEYINEHNPPWDIVYDDRGHFREPHTERLIGLGTINVRGYLSRLREARFHDAELKPANIETCGPDGCYQAIMFIEKEGFMPLFEAVDLAERYDIAIMSTKGLSVTAARQLIDEICGGLDIPCLVLHDFDKSGFSIFATLGRSNHRYAYHHEVRFIDLGLRLADIDGLETEDVYDSGSDERRAANLRKNGATPEEIEFLLHSRVELNAMASDELVEFVERKLQENGIRKIIPDKAKLEQAYRLFDRGRRIEDVVDEALEQFEQDEEETEVPTNLAKQVEKKLKENSTWRWDQAVASIVGASEPKLSLDPKEKEAD